MTHRTVVAAVSVIVGLLTAPQGQAQPAQARPSFEVASVKVNAHCEPGQGHFGISPGGLYLPCISLRALIRNAYGDPFNGGNLPARRLEALGGPSWLDSDRYDISAKAEAAASREQIMGPMLQSLIEERFNLKVHKEPRDAAVYALTVAKSGTKLQPSKEGSCTPIDLSNLPGPPGPGGGPGEPMPKYCGFFGGRGIGKAAGMVFDWYGMTIAEFAGMLPSFVDRPIVDKTGLTARFDIHLEFVPELVVSVATTLNGVPVPAAGANSGDASGPSIFVALEEQLGLKLSPARSPVDVIVVDRAERPSAN